jgi:hypothetical protein
MRAASDWEIHFLEPRSFLEKVVEFLNHFVLFFDMEKPHCGVVGSLNLIQMPKMPQQRHAPVPTAITKP